MVMPMNMVTVKQLDNDVTVVLPKSLREAACINIGDQVTIDSPAPGTIVIKTESQPWTLDSLMNGYEGPKPELIELGAAVGKEVW